MIPFFLQVYSENYKTTVDKLLSCNLPPSTHLPSKDEMEVLNRVLGQKLLDFNSVRKFVFKNQMQPPTTSNNENKFTMNKDLISKHLNRTVDFQSKEASGLVLLGIYIMELASALESVLNMEMYVEYEFPVCETNKPGLDFASDMALVSIVTRNQKVSVNCVVLLLV